MTPERGDRGTSQPDGLASDPVLVNRMRDEIRSNGPMTFARFMEIALYDPDRGYYRVERPVAGREGDFLTAPEGHPIFGAVLARQLDECWRLLDRPDRFALREYGAGNGSLAEAVIAGLRNERSGLFEALRYEPVELNEHRANDLRVRLDRAGFARVLGPFDEERVAARTVIANEFLDALPVHRVVMRGGLLRELFVDTEDGRFVELEDAPSTESLAARLASEGVTLDEGQRAEICLAIEPWVAEISGFLARGYAIVIDYGYPAAELYGPRRRAGTLLGYAHHAVRDDPLTAIGRQDLTAHVDLTALTAAGAACGLEHLGTTSQAEFLVGAGAADVLGRIQADERTSLADYALLRSALARMLDPRVTGGFAVVVLGRDAPRALSGLSFSARRRGE